MSIFVVLMLLKSIISVLISELNYTTSFPFLLKETISAVQSELFFSKPAHSPTFYIPSIWTWRLAVALVL